MRDMVCEICCQREVLDRLYHINCKKVFFLYIKGMDTIINASLAGLSKVQSSINQSAHKVAGYHLEVNTPTQTKSPADVLPDVNQQPIDKVGDYYQQPANKNTDLGEEVINMLQASRAYEANLRVVGAWSDMLEEEVNLLKK